MENSERPPPGRGPVFLPPYGSGPVFFPPYGPGPVFFPPYGSGPVLLPPPVFGVGHGGWRNTEPAPVLQQQTGLMAGLNRPRPAQVYSQAGRWNCAPVSHFPSNIMSNMRPAGIINEQPVYPLVPAAAELQTISNTNRKRKRQQQNDDDQPRAKKPLNAFMLYQIEQRRNNRGTDTVVSSKVLGDRWNNLSKDQQAIYFEQAQRQAKLQAQQHPVKPPLFDHAPLEAPSIPHWSISNNFDGESFRFDDTDQLMSVLENELVEIPSVPVSAPEALETPCLPDFTVVTPDIVEPVVPTPSPLVWSPSTEAELQNYRTPDVDWLVSAFESEVEAVITAVSDSTEMSPGHSAETPGVSDWTAETLGSPSYSPFYSPPYSPPDPDFDCPFIYE